MSLRSGHHAAACRRLWASVLLSAISDFNLEHDRKARSPQGGGRVLEAARRYLDGKDGQTIAARAGIEMNVASALRLIALPRREFSKLLLARQPSEEVGDDA